MIVWVILYTVFRIVLSEYIQTRGRLSLISSNVNASLVSHTYESVHSVLRCSSLCLKFVSPSFLYEVSNQTCYCYSDVDSSVELSVYVDAGRQYGYHTVSRIERNDGRSLTKTVPVYKDCFELYNEGYLDDGVYVIRTVGGVNIEVWCNQAHGGWTVIQRRMDGSEYFYRPWTDYVNGFGNVSGEYWLGLENIRLLTEESSYLIIMMHTFGDRQPGLAHVLYHQFGLSGSILNYQLKIDNYQGGCGDSLTYHNGAPFTTFDADNDQSDTNCAVGAMAGWWYRECYQSNLNGPYHQHGYINHDVESGITWHGCWGHSYSLKDVVMQIRRN